MTMQIAIDPGWNGALAYKDSDGMIVTEASPESFTGICDFLRNLYFSEDTHINEGKKKKVEAVIEYQQCMGLGGAKSMFRLSENYTAWRCACYMVGIPVLEVRPKQWMEKLGGVPSGSTQAQKRRRKNYIKQKMQQLYPQLKVTLENADALAILHVTYEI